MNELVTLYTSTNQNDPNMQAFQYYADYTGAEALRTAVAYLRLPLSQEYLLYVIIANSTDGKIYEVPLNNSLKNSGIITGSCLLVVPKPQVSNVSNVSPQVQATNYAAQGQTTNYQTQVQQPNYQTQIQQHNYQTQGQTTNYQAQVQQPNYQTQVQQHNYAPQVQQNYNPQMQQVQQPNYATQVQASNYATQTPTTNYQTQVQQPNYQTQASNYATQTPTHNQYATQVQASNYGTQTPTHNQYTTQIQASNYGTQTPTHNQYGQQVQSQITTQNSFYASSPPTSQDNIAQLNYPQQIQSNPVPTPSYQEQIQNYPPQLQSNPLPTYQTQTTPYQEQVQSQITTQNSFYASSPPTSQDNLPQLNYPQQLQSNPLPTYQEPVQTQSQITTQNSFYASSPPTSQDNLAQLNYPQQIQSNPTPAPTPSYQEQVQTPNYPPQLQSNPLPSYQEPVQTQSQITTQNSFYASSPPTSQDNLAQLNYPQQIQSNPTPAPTPTYQEQVQTPNYPPQLQSNPVLPPTPIYQEQVQTPNYQEPTMISPQQINLPTQEIPTISEPLFDNNISTDLPQQLNNNNTTTNSNLSSPVADTNKENTVDEDQPNSLLIPDNISDDDNNVNINISAPQETTYNPTAETTYNPTVEAAYNTLDPSVSATTTSTDIDNHAQYNSYSQGYNQQYGYNNQEDLYAQQVNSAMQDYYSHQGDNSAEFDPLNVSLPPLPSITPLSESGDYFNSLLVGGENENNYTSTNDSINYNLGSNTDSSNLASLQTPSSFDFDTENENDTTNAESNEQGEGEDFNPAQIQAAKPRSHRRITSRYDTFNKISAEAYQSALRLNIRIDDEVSNFDTDGDFGNLQDESRVTSPEDMITIQTYYTFTSEPFTVAYPKTGNLEQITRTAVKGCGKSSNTNFSVLIGHERRSVQWFAEDCSLDEYTNDGKLETTIWIFETEYTIDVKYPHNEVVQPITIDITKKVCDLLPEFASRFKITLPAGYTLLNKDGMFLNRKLSLPEQIHDFNVIQFQRAFHIYSSEDLATIETTRLAYMDARHEFETNKNIRVFTEQALDIFGALCVIEDINPEKLPTTLRSYFPESFNVPANFIKAFKAYSASKVYTKPEDEFNAMRKYIQVVRRTEGFGSIKIDHVKVEYTTSEAENSIKAYLLLTPLSLHIYNFRSNVLEESIPYSSILNFNLLSDALTIEFSLDFGTSDTYVFRCMNPSAIRSYIENYREVVVGILSQRAKQHEFNGKLNEIPETNRVYLYTTDDLALDPTNAYLRDKLLMQRAKKRYEIEQEKNPNHKKRKWKRNDEVNEEIMRFYDPDDDPFENILIPYDKNWTGEVTVKAAINFLLFQPDPNYVAMLKKNGVIQWLKPEENLVYYSVPDFSVIYILKNNQPIKITFSDQKSLYIKLDITKPIDELTKDVFQHLGCPGTYGYTFWLPTDPPTPLDNHLPIPDQCDEFHELIFKRRFFAISGDVLQHPILANQTVFDCAELIHLGKVQINEEKCMQLAILFIQAVIVKEPKDILTITSSSIKIEKIFPIGTKITKGLEDKFLKLCHTAQVMNTSYNAAKKYIGKVRILPGFGGDTFSGRDFEMQSWSAQKQKPLKKILFCIYPTKFEISDGKAILYSSPFRFVVQYYQDILKNILEITFVASKDGKLDTAHFYSRECETIYTYLHFYINTMSTLIIEKHNREKEKLREITMRLNGGYVDQKGILHQAMIDLNICQDRANPRYGSQRIWVDYDKKGSDIAYNLVEELNLDQSIECSCLLSLTGKRLLWCYPWTYLSELQPSRGSTLYLLPTKLTISLIFEDNPPIPAEVTIYENIVKISENLCLAVKIPYCLGYTLQKPLDSPDSKPLDICLSIPQQLTSYKQLLMIRRFFIITPSDLDPVGILHTFPQLKKFFLSQKHLLVDKKDIYTLGAILLVVEAGPHPSIPDYCTRFLPQFYQKGFKTPFTKALTEDIAKLDTYEAKKKFILTCQSTEFFAFESFGVILKRTPNEKSDKIVELPFNMAIGPGHIYCLDEKKNIIFDFTSDRILKVEYFAGDFSIQVLAKDNINAYVYEFASEQSKMISSLIQQYMALSTELLIRKIQLNMPDAKTHVELITVLNNDETGAVKLKYPLLSTGKDIISQLINEFHLNPKKEYSLLLKVCASELKWITDTDYLYNFKPFDGMTLLVYNSFLPINVVAPNGELTQVCINIAAKISDFIEDICFKANVQMWIGCSLYYKQIDKEGRIVTVPFDLCLTIPEQTLDFRTLYIKRRFFALTPDDFKNDILIQAVFDDVVGNVMSGLPVVDEAKVVELAVYKILAGLKNPKDFREVPHELGEFVPEHMLKTVSKTCRDKVKVYIKNAPLMSKFTAMRKYILLARALKNFGCIKVFSGEYNEDKAVEGSNNVSIVHIIKFTCGPFGIHIFKSKDKEKSKDKDEKGKNDVDIARISWDAVVSYLKTRNLILFEIASEPGKTRAIRIKVDNSEIAAEVYSLIRQYKTFLTVQIQRRLGYQSVQNDPSFKSISQKTQYNSVSLYLTQKISENIKMAHYKFNTSFSAAEILKLCRYYLSLPLYSHVVLYRPKNEKTLKYIGKVAHLKDVSPEDNGILLVIPKKPVVQVRTVDGIIHELILSMSKSIIQQISTATKRFGFGNEIGYTFWEKNDQDLRPLDFVRSIPVETENYKEIVLKRRFYVFTNAMMHDPETVNQCYEDVNKYIMETQLVMEDDTVILLALLSIFAKNTSKEEAETEISSVDEDNLFFYIPRYVSASKKLVDLFQKISIQIPYRPIEVAKQHYIYIASTIKNFATETYHVTFKNGYDNAAFQNGFVHLHLKTIEIYNSGNKHVIASIVINKISTIELVDSNTNVQIEYQDSDGKYSKMELSSARYATYVYTWVNDIICYIQMGVFQDEFITEVADLQVGDDDFDGVMQDIVFDENADLLHFDEIQDISAIQMNTSINGNVFSTFDPEIFGEKNPMEVQDDSLDWRLSNNGLLLDRKYKIINSIEEDLKFTKLSLETLTLEEFHDNLSILQDSLNTLNDESNDFLINQYNDIEDCFNELFTVGAKCVTDNVDLSSIKDSVSNPLQKLSQYIKNLRQDYSNGIVQFKSQVAGNNLIANTEQTEQNLILILIEDSELHENLATSFISSLPTVSKIKNPSELIKSLHQNSNLITQLANQLADPNMNTKVSDLNYKPVIEETKLILPQVKEYLDKAAESNIDVERISAHYYRLIDVHGSLEKYAAAAAQGIKNVPKSVFFGNNKQLGLLNNQIKTELEVHLETVNKYLAEHKKADKPELQNGVKVITNESNAIKGAVKLLEQKKIILNSSPINQQARLEAYKLLENIQNSLVKVVDTFEPIRNQKVTFDEVRDSYKYIVSFVPTIQRACDTIIALNITPTIIELIIQDIDSIVDRAHQISMVDYSNLNEYNPSKLYDEKDNQPSDITTLQSINIDNFDMNQNNFGNDNVVTNNQGKQPDFTLNINYNNPDTINNITNVTNVTNVTNPPNTIPTNTTSSGTTSATTSASAGTTSADIATNTADIAEGDDKSKDKKSKKRKSKKKKKETTESSDNELIETEEDFLLTTNSTLKTYSSKLGKINQTFRENILSGEIVYSAQAELLKIKDNYPTINKYIDLNQRIANNDQTFPVLYEQLKEDIEKALKNPRSTEDILNIPHVVALQQAMADAAVLGFQVLQLVESSNIQSDPNLSERINNLSNSITDNVKKAFDLRRHMFSEPYKVASIEDSKEYLLQLSEILEEADQISQNLALYLPDTTLPSLVTTAKKDYKTAKAAVDETSSLTLKEAPSQAHVNSYQTQVRQVLQAFDNLAEIKSFQPLDNPEIFALENAFLSVEDKEANEKKETEKRELIQTINSARALYQQDLTSLDDQLVYPSVEFYDIASRLGKSADDYVNYLSASQVFMKNKDAIKELRVINGLKGISDQACLGSSKEPTLDAIIGSLHESIAYLNDLTGELLDIKKLPEFAKEPDAAPTQFLKKWINDCVKTLKNIKQLNDETDVFTVQAAHQFKNELLNMEPYMGMIDPGFRRTLPDDYAKQFLVDNARTCAALKATIAAIRQLPLIEKPKLNPSIFYKIDEFAEIGSACRTIAKQIDELSNAFTRYCTYPDFAGREKTCAIFNAIIDELKKGQPYLLNHGKESEILPVLKDFKTSLPRIVNNALIVEPIIKDPVLRDASNILAQNVNLLVTIMESPHMDDILAEEFVRKVIDPSKEFKENLINKQNSMEDQTNRAVAQKFRQIVEEISQLEDIAKDSLEDKEKSQNNENGENDNDDLIERKGLPPRQCQSICDDVYRDLADILPILMRQASMEETTKLGTKLFELTQKYTTHDKVDLRITSAIQAGKRYPKETLGETVSEITTSLKENATIGNYEIYNQIYNELTKFPAYSDSLPEYLRQAALLARSALDMNISENSENLNLNKNNFNSHMKDLGLIKGGKLLALIEQENPVQQTTDIAAMAIQSTVKAGKLLASLRDSLDLITEQDQAIITDQVKYYLSNLKNAIKSTDIDLLLQVQSLSTAVFTQPGLQFSKEQAVLLSNSLLEDSTLKSIAPPIVETSYQFASWADESQLTFANLFMAECDQIAIAIEDYLKAVDNPDADLLDMIRKWVVILSSKERGYSIDYDSLNELTNDYFDFVTNRKDKFLGQIPPDSEIKQRINDSINRINKLQAVLKSWSKPNLAGTPSKARNFMLSHAFIAKQDVKIVASDYPNAQKNSSLLLSPIYTISSHLQFQIRAAIEILEKDVLQDLEEHQKMELEGLSNDQNNDNNINNGQNNDQNNDQNNQNNDENNDENTGDRRRSSDYYNKEFRQFDLDKSIQLLEDLRKLLDLALTFKIKSEETMIHNPMSDSTSPKTYQQEVTDLTDIIEQFVNLSLLFYPPDYQNKKNNIMDLSEMNEESTLSNITDPFALALAELNSQNIKIVHSKLADLEKVSTGPKVQESYRNQNIEYDDIKSVTIPRFSPDVHPLVDRASTKFIPLDNPTLNQIQKNSNEVILSEIPISIRSIELTNLSNENALKLSGRVTIAQKLRLLQQQQLSAFPDTIKTLNQIKSEGPTSTELVNKTTKDLEETSNQILAQLDMLDQNEEIQVYQNDLHPNDICFQQLLMAQMLNDLIKIQAPLPLEEYSQNLNQCKQSHYSELVRNGLQATIQLHNELAAKKKAKQIRKELLEQQQANGIPLSYDEMNELKELKESIESSESNQSNINNQSNSSENNENNQLIDKVFDVNYDIANEALSRGIAVSEFLTNLMTLSSAIVGNNPVLYKFASSPEGQELLTSNISGEELLKQQNSLQQQMELINNPELMKAYQHTLSADDLLIQVRLIQNHLKLLSNGKVMELAAKPTLKPTIPEILRQLNYEQINLAQEDPSQFISSSLVNPEIASSSMLSKYELQQLNQASQDLLNVYNRLVAIHKLQIDEKDTEYDEEKFLNTLKENEGKIIVEHLELTSTPDKLDLNIKNLSPEDAKLEAIQILHIMKNIYRTHLPEGNKDFDPNTTNEILKSEIDTNLSPLIEILQKRQFNLLSSNIPQLAAYDPLNDSTTRYTHSLAQMAEKNVQEVHNIQSVFETLQTVNPTLLENIKINPSIIEKALTFDSIDKARATMQTLLKLNTFESSKVKTVLSEMKEDSLVPVIALLSNALNANKEALEEASASSLSAAELYSDIYDKINVNQRIEKRGLVGNTPVLSKAVPTPETLSSSLNLIKRDLLTNKASFYINKLMIERNTVDPDLVGLTESFNKSTKVISTQNNTIEIIEADEQNENGELKSKKKFIMTPEKMKALHENLSQQMKELIETGTVSKDTLDQLSSDDLVLQQALLQHVYNIISNPNELEKESLNLLRNIEATKVAQDATKLLQKRVLLKPELEKITSEEITPMIAALTPEHISELQENLQLQLKSIDNLGQISQLISSLSAKDLILQQVLLQHMTKLSEEKGTINRIEQKVSSSEMNGQQAKEKIISSLFDQQLDEINKNKIVLIKDLPGDHIKMEKQLAQITRDISLQNANLRINDLMQQRVAVSPILRKVRSLNQVGITDQIDEATINKNIESLHEQFQLSNIHSPNYNLVAFRTLVSQLPLKDCAVQQAILQYASELTKDSTTKAYIDKTVQYDLDSPSASLNICESVIKVAKVLSKKNPKLLTNIKMPLEKKPIPIIDELTTNPEIDISSPETIQTLINSLYQYQTTLFAKTQDVRKHVLLQLQSKSNSDNSNNSIDSMNSNISDSNVNNINNVNINGIDFSPIPINISNDSVNISAITADLSTASINISPNSIDINGIQNHLSEDNVDIIDKTSIESNLEELFDAIKIHISSPEVLHHSFDINAEQVERLNLTSSLLELQTVMLKSNPKLPQFMKSNKVSVALNTPYSTPEIINFQDQIKSSLLLGNTVEDVTKIHQDIRIDNLLREFLLINNMIHHSIPTTTTLSALSTKSKVLNFENKQNNALNYSNISILNEDDIDYLQLDPIIAQLKPIEVKLPSEIDSLKAILEASKKLQQLLPIAMEYPIDECKSMLTASSGDAIELLQRLFNHTGTLFPTETDELLNVLPQLVSVYTRTLPSLPPKIKKFLVSNPMKLMEQAKVIRQSSMQLKNRSKCELFKKTVADLLNEMKSINAAIATPEQPIPEIELDTFAKIADSLLGKNSISIYSSSIDFDTLKIRALSFNSPIKVIINLEPIIAKIKPTVAKMYINDIPMNNAIHKAFLSLRQPFIDTLSRQSTNPIDLPTSSLPEILETIEKNKKIIVDLSRKIFRYAQKKSAKEDPHMMVNKMIKTIADSLIIIIKNLLVTDGIQLETFDDLLKIFTATSSAMKTMSQLVHSSALSGSSVQRTSRSFFRLMNRLLDLVSDLVDEEKLVNKDQFHVDLDSDSESSEISTVNDKNDKNDKTDKNDKAEKDEFDDDDELVMKDETSMLKQKGITQISINKTVFMKTLCIAAINILGSVSSRSESRVPETFYNYQKKNAQNVQKIIAELKMREVELLQCNTDPSLDLEFKQSLNDFLESFHIFQQHASTTQAYYEFDIISSLKDVSDLITNCIQTSFRLTDAEQHIPDLDSADLIQTLSMPPVPNDGAKEKVQDMCDIQIGYIKDLGKNISQFVEGSNGELSNRELAEIMKQCRTSTQVLITQMLKVSVWTNNFAIKQQMTGLSNHLLSTFNNFQTALKDRFLFIGDWHQTTIILLKELGGVLTEIVIQTKLAIKSADKDEKEKGVLMSKFMSILTPLKIIVTKIERYSEQIKTFRSSSMKAWSTKLLEISSKVCSIVLPALLYAKEHPRAYGKLPELFKFAGEVVRTIDNLSVSVYDICKGSIPNVEEEVIKQNDIILNLMNPYIESLSDKENDKKLKDNLITIIQFAEQMKSSAQSSRDTKEQVIQRAKQGKETADTLKNISQNAGEIDLSVARGRFLERLEMEGRVIKARYRLEFTEKLLEELNERINSNGESI